MLHYQPLKVLCLQLDEQAELEFVKGVANRPFHPSMHNLQEKYSPAEYIAAIPERYTGHI